MPPRPSELVVVRQLHLPVNIGWSSLFESRTIALGSGIFHNHTFLSSNIPRHVFVIERTQHTPLIACGESSDVVHHQKQCHRRSSPSLRRSLYLTHQATSRRLIFLTSHYAFWPRSD
ncbi:hypothetical protein NPIL_150221 [Nephila pilipes]|uniref:Uncharacterized protein n=1 Tax=Nephila pilipes TaxID=299642 RepID=A0A8X6PTZ2_NEPPI|nr:hypothetical protein NPIL_150221 [Nephila pilipes]